MNLPYRSIQTCRWFWESNNTTECYGLVRRDDQGVHRASKRFFPVGDFSDENWLRRHVDEGMKNRDLELQVVFRPRLGPRRVLKNAAPTHDVLATAFRSSGQSFLSLNEFRVDVL